MSSEGTSPRPIWNYPDQMSRNPFYNLARTQQQQQQQAYGPDGSRPPPARRSSSLAQDLAIVQHPVATSLAPPSASPLALTPLRAHYLKRELVTLQFARELSALDSPSSVSLLGPPFLPKSRFVDGVPTAKPPTPFAKIFDDDPDDGDDPESTVDLPFLRFIFSHFVLTFPFLASCPPTFFSHKLQPFVFSFVARNISTSEERDQETSRHRIAGKIEKHLGLVLSAAIKLKENDGREEVVRVEDESGALHVGVPSTQQSSHGQQQHRTMPTLIPQSAQVSGRRTPKPDDFSINVVSVRNRVVKSRMSRKTHEEFIIRTSKSGQPDVFVARRYGDFFRLAETLRKECLEEDVKQPPPKDRRSTENRTSASSPTSSNPDLPSSGPGLAANVPSLARERNRLTLRAYLRSILNNPVLSSSSAFQAFLLESPIELTEGEKRDVEIREEMDRMREEEANRFRTEVEARVEELEGYLRGFREELVKEDGLTRVFATIRHTPDVRDLPIEYRKVLEWARISLASTIYQLFLGSDNSSSVFSQLKRMHGLMPYFMLKGILKISNPVAMIRSVLDLFLARPFGSSSLLQKMFSSGLSDEARELREDSILVANKIADDRLTRKVDNYVNAPRELQEAYRAEAKDENLDIMTVILRADSQPVLDRATMQRIQRASVAYEEYKHYRSQLSDPEDDDGPDNDDAWLFEDLHVYMRVVTKARDKEQLVELIFEGHTSEVLKDIVTIFYEPLAKVYKAANIADSLTDLQAFLNDLIKTVEQAEEANLSEPQKTVQTFVDLVGRHEASFYRFVHSVHSKGEGLFDKLMSWIELFINFVRDGLPSAVSLESLLPHAGRARVEVLAEVDAVIEYHRKLKAAHYVRMKKRLVKGEQTDKDADTAFVTGVMDNLQISNVMGDVDDVTAEDSEEEEEGYGTESSSDDGDHEPEDVTGYKPWLHRTGTSTSTSIEKGTGTGSLLEVIPDKKRKKDRVTIEPPKLKAIPELVPVFVEMVRGELEAARKKAASRKY